MESPSKHWRQKKGNNQKPNNVEFVPLQPPNLSNKQRMLIRKVTKIKKELQGEDA